MRAVFLQVKLENCSHSVTVGHPKMRHPVERCASYKYLRRLPLKLPRAYSISEYRLEPEHLRLGKTPAVIPTLFLPLLAPYFSDSPKILISQMPLIFAVAVLPYSSIASRRYCCTRSSSFYSFITVSLVIRAVAADLLYLLVYLLNQLIKHLAVGKIVCSNYRSHYLTRSFVSPDMKLSPGPALRVAVLTNFPFTFTKYLYACRVYNHMQRLLLFTTRQLYLKPLATAAQHRVVRHGQIQAHQLNYREHQPLCCAQRQMINLLQSSHAQDGCIRVVARLAALFTFLVVAPHSKQVRANPESKASALNQSLVILFPVAETIAALGFFILHKLRLPALSSPCFMQQRRYKPKND